MIDPQQIHRERVVLGWCLDRSNGYDWCQNRIGPDAFELPAHRALFEAVARAARLHGKPNRFNVLGLLRSGTGEALTTCGGAEYVENLADSFASPAVAETYGKVLVAQGRKRRFLSALHGELSRAADAPDPTVYVENALRRLQDASRGPETDALLVPLRECVSEAVERIQEISARGGSQGVTSGIPQLDHVAGRMHGGELVILAARTSVGKTAFACSTALAAARSSSPVAVFSLEMSRADVAFRFLAAHDGLDLKRMRAWQFTAEEQTRFHEAYPAVCALPISVFGGNRRTGSDIDMTGIRTLCRNFRADHEKSRDGLIVVDYLQLVSTTGDERKRHEQVAEISRGLKQIAMELDWPVIALSQLNREADKRDRPKLSDLRESGAIEQDADRVLLLHRPGKDEPTSGGMFQPKSRFNQPTTTAAPNEVEIIIAKNRNGPLGVAKATFVEHCALFEGFNV